MKKALITGITGQDGSYLSELLLEKGYEVYGLERRVAIEKESVREGRIYHLKDKIEIVPAEITSYASVFSAICKVNPDEVYHLAAQSFVADSFKDPFQTSNINNEGTLNVLEALRYLTPEHKFYFAGSSEMFGKVKETPQNENTPFYPRSVYGITKVFGFELTRNYRESYGMFTCSGMLFNHESPRRGEEFVTRKITTGLAKIAKGLGGEIQLGNIDAKRDWGFSGDYVKAMWMMMQHEKPDDYVIATGETHTIREFVERASKYAGFDIEWQGKGINEKGIDRKTGKTLVSISKEFFRPADVELLVGDYSKAKNILGWKPEVKFEELVQMMVESDMELLQQKNK